MGVLVRVGAHKKTRLRLAVLLDVVEKGKAFLFLMKSSTKLFSSNFT